MAGILLIARRLFVPNDPDAVEKAKRLANGRDIELWSGPRFVIKLEFPKISAGPQTGVRSAVELAQTKSRATQ
jgi:hypothetical protein